MIFMITSMGNGLRQLLFLDDKPSTGGFMDLIQDIENLMLDITGKWQRGEELPEDSILQNFVKYHKMVADFDAREAAGVAPACP